MTISNVCYSEPGVTVCLQPIRMSNRHLPVFKWEHLSQSKLSPRSPLCCCQSAAAIVSPACVYTCARQSAEGVKLRISSAVNHPSDGNWRHDTRSHLGQSSYPCTLYHTVSPCTHNTSSTDADRGPLWRVSLLKTLLCSLKHFHLYVTEHKCILPWKHIFYFYLKSK